MHYHPEQDVFVCPECGVQDNAILYGHELARNLLDGIEFNVSIHGTVYLANVDERDAKIMKRMHLSVPMWLDAAAYLAKSKHSLLHCANCGLSLEPGPRTCVFDPAHTPVLCPVILSPL